MPTLHLLTRFGLTEYRQHPPQFRSAPFCLGGGGGGSCGLPTVGESESSDSRSELLLEQSSDDADVVEIIGGFHVL